MLVVAALGGNALLQRGERADAKRQRRNIERAAKPLAEIAGKHQLVVCHGNGPQVGLLALQSEAYKGVDPFPLDVLDAESEGMIGYPLEQALGNALPGRETATLLTQVVVDAGDPALTSPSKPIGPVYDLAGADRLSRERGWKMAPDGPFWRRVVASPAPVRIVELASIRALLDAGVIVICAGGGGVPVLEAPDGTLDGIEAVIDKDLSAGLVAAELGAEALLLLTDVPAVELDWGKPEARRLTDATPEELRSLRFAAGSMQPKVTAAAQFVGRTGRRAVIGSLDDAAAMLEGRAGTQVRASRAPAELRS
jgi:carbamate kinase